MKTFKIISVVFALCFLPCGLMMRAADFAVNVSKDGEIKVQGEKKTLKELTGMLEALASKKDETAVIITAPDPKGPAFGTVVHVLDSCRRLGFDKISFQAEKEKK